MITVFIGTFNRLSTLERTIKSYKRLKTPHELVIIDNGTDHPACVKLLDRLETTGKVKRIYRLPGCESMDEATDNFNSAIRWEYESGDAGEWFAVSEADVCFDGTDPKALDAYIRLATDTGHSVGPHLRVDKDIPACYPLRSRVLACESRLLYRDLMYWHDGEIPYTHCQTDTTFHLFPATRRFDRLHMDPLRVGPPFDAMHLDWYLDITKPVRENGIYIAGQREVGSWGKAWIRNFWFWWQERGPEYAFRMLQDEPVDTTDLCNVSLIMSWALQYGHGTPIDLDESKEWLLAAIPSPHEHYSPYEARWLDMIYRDDFSSLGWDDTPEKR